MLSNIADSLNTCQYTGCFINNVRSLTRDGPGLRNFRGRPGGLDAPPPHLTRLQGIVAKNGKKRSEVHQKFFETISINFSLRSVQWSSEVIKVQMTQMVFR